MAAVFPGTPVELEPLSADVIQAEQWRRTHVRARSNARRRVAGRARF